jgi:hypothetical protein
MPWRGPPKPRVRLELHSAFFLEGSILAAPDTFQEGFGPVITVWATHDERSFQVASTGPLPAGELDFGPIAVPSTEADTMEARLEAAAVGWVAAPFSPPAPGQTVRISLEPPRAFAIQVDVTDADGAPLTGAWVRTSWNRGQESITQDALHMGEGHFVASSCPAVSLHTAAGAEGYATSRLPDVTFPQDEGRSWFLAELQPARMIHGSCSQNGKPARDFTIEYWHRNQHGSRGELQVKESADGSFRIPDGPPGEVSVLALGPNLERSDLVTLAPGEEAEIRLVLSPPRYGIGVIKDAEGAPLASAKVTLQISQGGRSITTIGRPIQTEPDGSFRIPGIGVGENRLQITAESFGQATVSQYGPVEGPLDFGEIVLGKLHQLTVHAETPPGLLGGGPATIGTDDPSVLPDTPLASDGTLELPSIPAGQHLFKLGIPDRFSQYKARAIPTGGASVLEFDLTGGSSITVELKDTTSPDESIFVDLRYTDPLGDIVDTCAYMTSSETWTLHGIAPGLVKATALGNATDTMAKGSLMVANEGEEHQLTLTLSTLRPLLRIVDTTGSPVAGADVMLYPDGGLGPDIFTRSDQDGTCRFPELPEDVRFATIYGPDRGIAQGLPFTPPPPDGEPVDLLFDPSTELHIEFQAFGSPAVGVVAQLAELHRSLWVGTPKTSQAQGQVDFPKLAPGPYALHIWGDGYWPLVLDVPAPQASPEPIAVWPTTNLTLHVVDAEGLPLPHAQVALIHEGLGESPTAWLAEDKIQSSSPDLTTDAQGELMLEGLPAGSYIWTVGGIEGTLETNDGSTPVLIVLP